MLNHSQAERKLEVQPNRIGNHVRRETVAAIEVNVRHTVISNTRAQNALTLRCLWKRLDVALAKVPDMILCHKGAKGVEKIAAEWARSRKVPQIIFRPNWPAFKKAAPFRANDEMIRAKVKGAIVFGTKSGIALNLADKLEEKAKHVSRIKGPEKTRDA
ncbi:DUF2493 domain-containing protein [Palleronia caenipelagi]|uniref:DUF2493 domain-containing protein n=1 Tax=Palleronia caenipelagi TaxID=2489174 RepID=A0A547PI53_9RHOB|nr:DUF2493 domain-containing protein [Palleronia caenipelagi]